MMKFKQRVVVFFFVVAIIVIYLLTKLKSSSGRNPLVEVDEDNMVKMLLLDSSLDLDKRDTLLKGSNILATLRRTRDINQDGHISRTTKYQTIKDREMSFSKTKERDTTVGVFTRPDEQLGNPWEMWNKMVSSVKISANGSLGNLQVNAILKALATFRFLKVGVGFKGTQLKASVFLEGNQRTVFKPKRYDRNFIIRGNPYAGYDRHNGEIAAFHLDRLLGFYRAPLVSGRIVNLKTEVLPATSEALKKTFFTQGENTCFYGVCYYCKREDPACADGDMMEGSITLWLPVGWNLVTWRHPWQRTYSSKGRKARWETDPTYCHSVMNTAPYDKGPRLTSIIDTAIFDFIIGNADRHHYETFQHFGKNGLVLHLDNGKSFGNPETDEMSILAPLYQCCRILHSTWKTLKELINSKTKPLSEKLKELLSIDPISPVLTQGHLRALDRRLQKVIQVIRQCITQHSEKIVLVAG